MPDRCQMVLLKGPPGCGKSTIASALTRRLRYALIDKDDVNDVLQQHLPAHTPEPGGLAYGGLAYIMMFRIARRLLLNGTSVICDSPLTTQWTYQNAREVASDVGARVVIIECFCSDEALWRHRIENRDRTNPAPHRIASWEQLTAYRAQYAATGYYSVTDPHIRVDSARPLEAVLTNVEIWLSSVLET